MTKTKTKTKLFSALLHTRGGGRNCFFLLVAVAALLFTACEKVLELENIDSQRQITINGLQMADSVMYVNLTYSRFFLDNSPFVAVTGADVTIDVDGAAVSCTSQYGANYMFNRVVQGGDSLTLHVCIAGMEEMWAGTRVPQMPNTTTPLVTIDTTQAFTMGDVTFTLSDPDGRNHYRIFVMERDSGERWNGFEEKWDTIDTVVHSYFTCLNREITAPEVNCSEGFLYYYNDLLFTDSLIDGADYEVTLSIPLPNDTAENPIRRDYWLVIESLSREAFLYNRDVAATQGIGQYFAEPSAIYSNINGNALGIFAGIARREYYIELKIENLNGS